MRTLLLSIILLLSVNGLSQSIKGGTYSFTDPQGVQFEIQHIASLPALLDSTFWKNQFSPRFITYTKSAPNDHVLYKVTDVKTIQRNKTYVLRIGWSHTKGTIQELLNFGYSTYRLTLSRSKDGAYKIDLIAYLTTEI
jgi:hypothetical protein